MRLTYQMSRQAQVRAPISIGIIKFRGHECPALLGRGGVRHPQPEALLHGAGEVHRRRSPTSCWSKPAGRRTTRPIRPTRTQDERAGRPTSRRLDRTTTERWSSVIGPYYFRVPDRHTYTRLGLLRHRLARPQDRHAARQRRQPPSADRWPAASTCTRSTRQQRRPVPQSVIVYNTPQEAAERHQATTSGSTSRTRLRSTG